MRLTYDPRYNIAYIRFQEKQTDVETVRISDELVVDTAPDGIIYGIELLNAKPNNCGLPNNTGRKPPSKSKALWGDPMRNS